MSVKNEIIKRIAALLLNGFTVDQCKENLINGEIANKDFSDELADKYIAVAVDLIDTDVG